MAAIEMNRGCLGIWGSANMADDFPTPGELGIVVERYPLTEQGYPAGLFASDSPRERQFDIPAAFRLLWDWDKVLGENAAADGWVPSPGAELPKPELKSVRLEIGWWALVLTYILLGTLMMAGWQRRKIRLIESAVAPPS